MRVVIALLIVHLGLLAAPMKAQADDLIVAKAYFVDASASLSFADLQGKTFIPTVIGCDLYGPIAAFRLT